MNTKNIIGGVEMIINIITKKGRFIRVDDYRLTQEPNFIVDMMDDPNDEVISAIEDKS